jgi:hypothetical protein
MKKKLTAIVIASFAIMTSNAQNVGIGTTTPLAQLSVGNNSQFQVNNTGNLIRINNIAYSFPSVQGGANQILKNDGSGNLVWSPVPAAPSVPKPVVRIFNLVANAFFNAWLIDDAADYNAAPFNSNPTLVLHRGFTYQFDNNSFGHPFRIAIANGGAQYNVGVTNNDAGSGLVTFTVPMDAPATLYYYCTIHPAMNGVITIQ